MDAALSLPYLTLPKSVTNTVSQYMKTKPNLSILAEIETEAKRLNQLKSDVDAQEKAIVLIQDQSRASRQWVADTEQLLKRYQKYLNENPNERILLITHATECPKKLSDHYKGFLKAHCELQSLSLIYLKAKISAKPAVSRCLALCQEAFSEENDDLRAQKETRALNHLKQFQNDVMNAVASYLHLTVCGHHV